MRREKIEFLIEGFLAFGKLIVIAGECYEDISRFAYRIASIVLKKGIKVFYLDGHNSISYIKKEIEHLGLYKELGENFFLFSNVIKVVPLNEYNSASSIIPSVKERLKRYKSYTEPEDFLYLLSIINWDISINPDNLAWNELKEFLRGMDKSLVIIDTLWNFLGNYDPNSITDMKKVMRELKEIRNISHAVLVFEIKGRLV
ncbi:MAG: hypothetical protein QXT86_12620 [Archaeoglobaceae archaeon]